VNFEVPTLKVLAARQSAVGFTVPAPIVAL
jgi:hypothetical protein